MGEREFAYPPTPFKAQARILSLGTTRGQAIGLVGLCTVFVVSEVPADGLHTYCEVEVQRFPDVFGDEYYGEARFLSHIKNSCLRSLKELVISVDGEPRLRLNLDLLLHYLEADRLEQTSQGYEVCNGLLNGERRYSVESSPGFARWSSVVERMVPVHEIPEGCSSVACELHHRTWGEWPYDWQSFLACFLRDERVPDRAEVWVPALQDWIPWQETCFTLHLADGTQQTENFDWTEPTGLSLVAQGETIWNDTLKAPRIDWGTRVKALLEESEVDHEVLGKAVTAAYHNAAPFVGGDPGRLRPRDFEWRWRELGAAAEKAFEGGHPDSGVLVGLHLLCTGQTDRGYHTFCQAARMGSSEAAYRAALHALHHGLDEVEAWVERATELGDGQRARYLLAHHDPTGRQQLLQQLAEEEHPESCFWLGFEAMARGDDELGLRLLKLAAAAGIPQAAYNLAVFHLRRGLSPDGDRAALYWLHLATELAGLSPFIAPILALTLYYAKLPHFEATMSYLLDASQMEGSLAVVGKPTIDLYYEYQNRTIEESPAEPEADFQARVLEEICSREEWWRPIEEPLLEKLPFSEAG